MPAVAQGPEAAGSGTASTSPASTGSPDAEVGSGALPPASGAIEPSGAAPSAANAGIPGSSIPGGNPMAGVPSQAPAQTSPPPGGTLPTETLPTPGERDPRPPYWGNSGPRAQSLPERRGRPLAWRYPSIAAAREAELRGEITPDERNQVIVELRRARQAERSRAIRDYRAGYIGRGVLRARLRDIERRYDGPFGDYPRAGIHVWP